MSDNYPDRREDTAILLAKPTHCQVCGRMPGEALWNRYGGKDLCPETPLGDLERCPKCKLFACPDCLHELECCELFAIKEEA